MAESPSHKAGWPPMPERTPLFPAERRHLESLTDSYGIQQHARGSVPDPAFGTCTDDVARALIVDLDHADTLGWDAVDASVRRSVAYLEAAFQPSVGRFRNFRSSCGTWLDEGGSEDCQGRALLGLAHTAARAHPSDVSGTASRLLEEAVPLSAGLSTVRGLSWASLALATTADMPEHAPLLPDLERLADRLEATFTGGAYRHEWPWPEEAVTYESALPPRALITVGDRLGRPRMVDRGLLTLDWLRSSETSGAGLFRPIGNQGWWSKGGVRATFDQQPIEAGSVVLAAEAAFAVRAAAADLDAGDRAYAWFLGANEFGISVADPARGSCHDGLGPSEANPNQGAESTLAWLSAVEAIRRLRRPTLSQGGRTPVDGEAVGRRGHTPAPG